MVKALIVQPDKTYEIKEIKPNLKTLQKIVGGYIEFIPLQHGHAYANEDGRFLNLEVNPLADMLCHAVGWLPNEYLVGPIIFLGNRPGGEADVPAEILDKLPNLEKLLVP